MKNRWRNESKKKKAINCGKKEKLTEERREKEKNGEKQLGKKKTNKRRDKEKKKVSIGEGWIK